MSLSSVRRWSWIDYSAGLCVFAHQKGRDSDDQLGVSHHAGSVAILVAGSVALQRANASRGRQQLQT